METSKRKLSSYKNRRKKEGFNTINVTPFVDVMLVLLIVFMVTAPMLKVNVPINLPKVSGGNSSKESSKKKYILSIDKHGMIYFNNTQTTYSHLQKLIIDANVPDGEKLYVRGDKDASYGRIMELITFLSSIGYVNIALQGDQVNKK